MTADVLVPGTRPGTIGAGTAASLPPGVRVIAPAANAPYTAAGADVLRRRGIVALPDFVCNAGAVIGYRSAADATPDQVLAAVGARISGAHPRGAGSSLRPGRGRLRAGRAVPAWLVGRAARPAVRTPGVKDSSMQTWEAITSRRNVRSFAGRPIPAADLDQVPGGDPKEPRVPA